MFRATSTACVFVVLSAVPASADVILITQAKVNAGSVTPGDAVGFPATLSQPGSYRLASNLTVAGDTNGIKVTADQVTIDLGGFSVFGAGAANSGIVDANSGLTVRNGTITGFRYNGIYATGNLVTVEDMEIINNGRDGIGAGSYSRVRNTTLVGNTGSGLSCGASCQVQSNIASDNGGTGISASAYAVISGNTVHSNGANGITCVDCHIESNQISANGYNGIQTSNSTILGNNITGNHLYGVSTPQYPSGIGNNRIATNNNGGDQVSGTLQIHPNSCVPACP